MTKNVGGKPNVKKKRRPHVNRGSSLKKRARRSAIKHDLPRPQNGRMAAHMWDVSQDAEDPELLQVLLQDHPRRRPASSSGETTTRCPELAPESEAAGQPARLAPRRVSRHIARRP